MKSSKCGPAEPGLARFPSNSERVGGSRRPLRLLLLLALMCAAALAVAVAAGAATGDEDALAQKYSPVVRLVEQPVECGPGEPYIPIDVDLLFGQPTVALRGPWNTTDLVKIGPSAQDLVNRYEYHLDFPGSALSPGCDYERWQRRLARGRRHADGLRARRDRPRATRASSRSSTGSSTSSTTSTTSTRATGR